MEGLRIFKIHSEHETRSVLKLLVKNQLCQIQNTKHQHSAKEKVHVTDM